MVLQGIAVFLPCGDGNFIQGDRINAALGEQLLTRLDKTITCLR